MCDALIGTSLSNYEILDSSKLKAFPYNILDLVKRTEFVFDGVENRVGKGEHAGYHHTFKLWLVYYKVKG